MFINTTTTRHDFWSGEGVEVPAGTGSGFVYDDKGRIVTNYHVVRQAKACTVVFGDGTEKAAKLVGVSPRHDLAVLEVDGVLQVREGVSVRAHAVRSARLPAFPTSSRDFR